MTRIEFSIRADDAEILARMAKSRGCSVAELVRRSLYQSLEPLGRAQHEREMKTAAEVDERRKLRRWNEASRQSSDYDPAAPERYAPWLEE